MGDRDDEETVDEPAASGGETDDREVTEDAETVDEEERDAASEGAETSEGTDGDEPSDDEGGEDDGTPPSPEDIALSRESDLDTDPRDDVPYGPEPPPGHGDREPVVEEPAPELPDDLEGDFDDEGAAETRDDGPLEGPRDGAPADQEMPLTAHIEEMLRRGAVVVFVVVIAAVVVFPFGEEIIDFLWASALPQTDTRPHLYQPLELLITQIKIASLAGVIVSLPMLVYESYLFMRPGLYPHERRYYLAAVPTSLVLAFVGLVFGYFVLLPAIFTYFFSYSQKVADIAFALGRTFDLILVLLGYLAVIFQLPLFIMLAMMMGIVTREWLVQRRLLFWFSFLGLSFFVSPDPTGMAPIILTATMIVLFEGTLFLAKWTDRGRAAMGG